MNISKFKAIRSSNLASNERYVLFILNSYANENGECWPSVDIIAKGTGLNKRTVFRCLAELKAIGLVSLYENPNGKTNVYKIHYEKIHSDTQSRVTKRHGCHSVTDKHDTESPVSDTLSPKQRHSVMGGVTHSHCIYNEEVPNEDTSEETTEKRKGKNSKIPDYKRTFDELWDEVRDKPFLEQMAHITKGHPAVCDRFPGIIISAVEHVAYCIIKDHKEDCLKRKKQGQPLNDWDEGILRGESYFKGLFLEHYQHLQNAERLIFGESIPEESKVFMPYYQMAFDEFVNRCRNLFSQYQEKALDPEWAPFCHRYGDGPWIRRKYTSS